MDSDHDLDSNYDDMVWSDQNWYLQVFGVKGNPAKITVSAGFGGLEVHNVYPSAFFENKKLKTVDLSKTKIQIICEDAFEKCSSLTNVKFPVNLKKIGQRAFQQCLKLKTVDLSRTSVESINRSAFYMCDSLTSVKCPASLKEIGWYVFSTCRNLRTADLSKTKLTKTSMGLFVVYRSLERVKLPKNITEIGEKSFAGCIKLKTLDLSKTKLKKISRRAYFDCFTVKLIKLPSTVKSIGEEAFTASVSTPLDTIVVTPLSAKKIGYTKAKAGKIWSGRKVSVCTYAYKIKFDKNGAKKGSMPSLTCGGGIKTKLPANKFKRVGYQFNGWNTKKNGKGTASRIKES